ncbi:hypothetical protein PANO111632_02540 [Paracoccus nototheniae]|uniref:Holin n=1 Tax=Paracoccus nototheniae TaxID=2489002 RepID=A0ABW4DYT9_9RHOB|nr:hypothetical protein [Paracoccus nototheniae]
MNRTTPALAAVAAALIMAPVAALAANSMPDLLDQGISWLAAALATAAASAIAATVAKITGATLDAKARATIEVALQRAARIGLEWLLDEASDTPLGQRLTIAAQTMLPYVDEGAGHSLKRFGLDAAQAARPHLQDMARAELIKQLGEVAPDKLAAALTSAVTASARVSTAPRPTKS